MKALTIVFLLVLITTQGSCLFSNRVKIKLHNGSDIYLDSTVIFVNNYKLTIAGISPASSFVRNIPEDSIQINPHDVVVRAIAYDKNNTKFKGGLYYNDLFMPNKSLYTITLTKDSTIIIQ